MALDSIGVLSPDGSSKSFDASANGYARGDAVEAVYIKRLDDALRDGNPVRAIIRATAINSVSWLNHYLLDFKNCFPLASK